MNVGKDNPICKHKNKICTIKTYDEKKEATSVCQMSFDPQRVTSKASQLALEEFLLFEFKIVWGTLNQHTVTLVKEEGSEVT